MYSLRRRLLLSATLLLLVFLGVMGVGLNEAFKRSVLSSAQDTLRNQILLLISSVDVIDGEVIAPAVLSEVRLQQPDSDLFAQILVQNSDQQPSVLWRSPSLLERSLPVVASKLGEFQFHESTSWDDLSVNISTLAIEWETEQGTIPFVLQVAESDVVYERRLFRYQRQVGVWLLFFGGALIFLLLGVLGWALKPLERVRTQIRQIELGERQRFDEDYPMEVNRLTQNLNQLLSFEERRIQRQKEVLGNLAHSLKTPIAVLKGLPYSSDVKQESDEQLTAMQTIIDYQLQSASAVGRRRFAKAVDIEEASRKVVRSLEKLHSHRAIKASLEIQPGVVFYGDMGDWMEVFGNLCDNAFKWASQMVRVSVEQIPSEESGSHKKSIRLTVEDDGAGIDAQQKQIILQRGGRLDSQTPGHGLGMHIVKGIVEAYDGSISIENTTDDAKGTRFVVILN